MSSSGIGFGVDNSTGVIAVLKAVPPYVFSVTPDGNSAVTDRPIHRDPLVSLYAGHPSLPPGYDPFADTHDSRMEIEGDE